MDWSRAKSILIIMFFGLNLFLMINLAGLNRDGEVSHENIANTEKILLGRGYWLKCEIPSGTRSQMLEYENGTIDMMYIAKILMDTGNINIDLLEQSGEMIKGSKKLRLESGNTIIFSDENPMQSINLSNLKSVKKHVVDFLRKLRLPISEYYLYAVRKNSDNSVTLLFNERYKDYLIYYNQAEVLVTDRGIAGVRISFVKPKQLKSLKNKIVPAYKVLLKNFIKGNKNEITGMDLGFLCSYHEKSMLASEGLVWRVIVDGKKEMYFNASTAEIISEKNVFSE